METGKSHLVERMRLVARIVGFTVAGFFLIFLIIGAATEVSAKGWGVIEIEGSLLFVITAIALAGCILSWRRERLAGILLVLSAAAMGVHIGICAGRNHLLVWSMLGLPYLVAGVLFLNSWRLSKIGGSGKS